MSAYQKAFAPDANLIIDEDCSSVAAKSQGTRLFQLLQGARVTDISLSIDLSALNPSSDARLKTEALVEGYPAPRATQRDLSAIFTAWVDNHSVSLAQSYSGH